MLHSDEINVYPQKYETWFRFRLGFVDDGHFVRLMCTIKGIGEYP